MPITDYAEQLTENPELTAEKTDGGTIYEDKNGRKAGYIRADGRMYGLPRYFDPKTIGPNLLDNFKKGETIEVPIK